jgi:hypothetical protein
VRLLAVSRIMLSIIEDNTGAADLVSSSFAVELRSMISATERHVDFGMDGDWPSRQ